MIAIGTQEVKRFACDFGERAGVRQKRPGSRNALDRSMLTIILIVLLLMALGGGGWAHSRYGYAGWSPAGLVLLVLAILWLTGNLH